MVCAQVVWLKGLEQVQAVVDLLAAGLLAGLESRGEEPDAQRSAQPSGWHASRLLTSSAHGTAHSRSLH